jgi:NAD(P)H-hydrate repair Nnr-like enzyme with NAD(P)H-hydrate dehydratase domain
LLKGATQYCVKSDGNALLAVPGPAWTAQAGSGDVLAGIAGTLLAAGLDAQLAGALAASAQAITAASYPGPYPPDRLAELLPGIIGR